ncbi:hypothetical protein KW489_16070 [Vibrio fluvialis]|nr:hypothetical protein [Vibrio fluvialis]MBY7800078.1 hypothetical protein [Vibrio fluvialis]MBY8091482.1 hypothetical protein [Vibrio fluvialis]
MVIDAILLTFNPNVELLKKSLSKTVSIFDHVYIFDNGSDNFSDIECICNCHENLTLCPSKENLGIKGLNKIAIISFDNGSDAITILDQDSTLPNGYRDGLFTAFERYSRGVFAPIYSDGNIKYNCLSKIHKLGRLFYTKKEINLVRDGEYIGTDFIIGSGMSIRKSDWLVTGGFNESFFLDCADIDFCLRLKKNLIPIYYIKSYIMDHKIGSEREKVLGIYHVSMHSPYRHYLYFDGIMSIILSDLSPWSFKIHYSVKLFVQYFIYGFLVSDASRHRKLINKAIIDRFKKLYDFLLKRTTIRKSK